uniref:Tyrosine-protein kinase n=1 Tax=Anopheles minimus TaxID=112268 RepID=A0A182W6M0_9DIPT
MNEKFDDGPHQPISTGSSPAQNSTRSTSPNVPNGHLPLPQQQSQVHPQQQQQLQHHSGSVPVLQAHQQQAPQPTQHPPQQHSQSHSPSLQHPAQQQVHLQQQQQQVALQAALQQQQQPPQLQQQTSQQSSHHLNSSSSSLGNITPTFVAQPQSPTVNSFKTASLNGVGLHVNGGGDLNMPGGPTVTPGTPNTKAKDVSPRVKIVVALYPFKAIESGDLSLEKNAEYEVIDDSQEHWWKVKDQHGTIGYIPSNYVKEKELLGLQKYDWYVGDMSRQRAESLLKQNDKEGCFVVRKSSTKGLYTLSLHTKVPQSHVKHYHIKQNARSEFYLSEKHCCETIPDLINYHRHNSGGLACRLKTSPCDRPVPPTAGLSHDKWEIHPSELMILEELGSGQFGVVRRAKWRGSIDTAVKMMKVGTMSEDDFIEEAKVMTYGVLMWEVFTCGKMPYGRLKNTEVVERVQRGIILEKPKACAKEIYDVMKKCWSHSPEDRPGFRILKDQLAAVAQGLTD